MYTYFCLIPVNRIYIKQSLLFVPHSQSIVCNKNNCSHERCNVALLRNPWRRAFSTHSKSATMTVLLAERGSDSGQDRCDDTFRLPGRIIGTWDNCYLFTNWTSKLRMREARRRGFQSIGLDLVARKTQTHSLFGDILWMAVKLAMRLALHVDELQCRRVQILNDIFVCADFS